MVGLFLRGKEFIHVQSASVDEVLVAVRKSKTLSGSIAFE
jgi:hypothetical protein